MSAGLRKKQEGMTDMKRKIIKIEEDKCNGCGLCAQACHEGAIGMVEGKAKLLRDDYCDGLGDCLPVCPTGAISFEEREAEAYDAAAVQAHMVRKKSAVQGGCPGSRAQIIKREEELAVAQGTEQCKEPDKSLAESCLTQWPVQIKLVPVNAPYFDNARLLIAADCTAFAYGDFHQKFLKNHIVLIGCPKLDEGDYAEKLTEIFKRNQIKSVTVVRMEVPCCGGIANAAIRALQDSDKMIPWQIVTISTDGKILDE